MWIEDGEKYALVGLTVKIDGHLPPGKITPNLWVFADTTFNVPPHWQEWLGSIRAQEVEDCNLFLLSKLASLTPDVLDAENQKLQQRVWTFYVGLLLAPMASMTYQKEGTNEGRTMTWYHQLATILSFVFFLVGMGIVVIGAYLNLP